MRTLSLLLKHAILSAVFFCFGCSNYVPGDAARNMGHPEVARRLYESRYSMGDTEAGLRLAEMYAKGLGGPEEPGKTFAIYERLAAQGIPLANHNLGYCYEYGVGVMINYPKAARYYREAGIKGYVPALYNLGSLYANGHLAANDVEGLIWLLTATALAGDANSIQAKFIRDDPPGHRKKLSERMTALEVQFARNEAQVRAKEILAFAVLKDN